MASASGRDVNSGVQNPQLENNSDLGNKSINLLPELPKCGEQDTGPVIPGLQGDGSQFLDASLNTSDLIDISLSLADDTIDEEWFFGQQSGEQQCNICGKEFADPKALIRHIQYVHNTEKKFQCPMCTAAFKQLTHLRSHLRMHTGEKPFECPECGSRFARNSTMKVHLRHYCKHAKMQGLQEKPPDTQPKVSLQEQGPGEAANYTHICPLCGQVFASSRGLSRHMSSCGTSQLKCSFCGAANFKTVQELQTHSLTHMQSQLFTCTRCSAVFMDYSKYSQHLRNHTERRPFQCTLCGKAFKQSGHLRDHIRSHTGDRPFKCSDCGKSFLRKFQLKQHALTRSCNPDALKNLSESGADDDEQEEKLPLDLSADRPGTNDETKSQLGFQVDMFPLDSRFQSRNFDGETPENNDTLRSEEKIKNQCEKENKDNVAKADVDEQGTKLPHALHECFVCKLVFSSEIDLKTHQYIAMHLDSVTYQCEKCDEVFQDSKSLSLHMRSHGGNDRPYTCPHCGDCFKESHHLKYHVLVHTGERPYKCDFCPSAFARQYQLKCHLEKHERGEISPLDLPESKTMVDLSLPAGSSLPDKSNGNTGVSPVTRTSTIEAIPKSIFVSSQSVITPSAVSTASVEHTVLPLLKTGSEEGAKPLEKSTSSVPDAVGMNPMNLPLVSPMFYLPPTGLPLSMVNVGGVGLPQSLFNMAMPGVIPPTTIPNQNLISDIEMPAMSMPGPVATTLSSTSVVSVTSNSSVTPPVTNLASVPANSRHLGIPTAERPHVCNICGKGFKLRHHLKEHLRTHTDDKPYKCDQCGGSYARKSQLNSHLRRRHGLAIPSLSPGAMSPGSTSMSTSPSAAPPWLPNHTTALTPGSQPMSESTASVLAPSSSSSQAGIGNTFNLTTMLPTLNLINDLQQRQIMLSSWYGAMMANITATQQLLGMGPGGTDVVDTAQNVQVAAETILNNDPTSTQSSTVNHTNNNSYNGNGSSCVPNNNCDTKESPTDVTQDMENKGKTLSEEYFPFSDENPQLDNNDSQVEEAISKNSIQYTCHICKQTFHDKGALTSHLQDHSFEDILNASLFKSQEDNTFQLGAVVNMMT